MTAPETTIDDDPIVKFTARRPDLHHRLLAEHVDDGTGHCRVCTVSAQAGYRTWPYNITGYVIRVSPVRPLGPRPSPTPSVTS